jgi:hypothetical protein
MVSKGAFGYIIGRKKRLMCVQNDADLLWQILVREIYVLMKHYDTKELLQEAFEKIKVVKGNPKLSDIKKYKIFTNLEQEENNNWDHILRYCQSSFINILEAGCILKQENDNPTGFIFLLDFNKMETRFYWNDSIQEKATIEEIMCFDEMPIKTYTEIVSEMRIRFSIFNEKVCKIDEELEKLYKLKRDASIQGAANIEEKVDKLIHDMKWELKELNMTRRVFYHRLKALDLISDE